MQVTRDEEHFKKAGFPSKSSFCLQENGFLATQKSNDDINIRLCFVVTKSKALHFEGVRKYSKSVVRNLPWLENFANGIYNYFSKLVCKHFILRDCLNEGKASKAKAVPSNA